MPFYDPFIFINYLFLSITLFSATPEPCFDKMRLFISITFLLAVTSLDVSCYSCVGHVNSMIRHFDDNNFFSDVDPSVFKDDGCIVAVGGYDHIQNIQRELQLLLFNVFQQIIARKFKLVGNGIVSSDLDDVIETVRAKDVPGFAARMSQFCRVHRLMAECVFVDYEQPQDCEFTLNDAYNGTNILKHIKDGTYPTDDPECAKLEEFFSLVGNKPAGLRYNNSIQ